MNPEAANLLEQLRDIHAAPDAPFWPPAPGWWVLAALLLVALFLLGRRLLAAWAIRRRRQRWLDHLETTLSTIDPETQPHDYLATVNQQLKAVAIRAFPGEGCARLEGRAWAAFLQGKLDLPEPVSELEALVDGPYQPEPSFDVTAVAQMARTWIRQYG